MPPAPRASDRSGLRLGRTLIDRSSRRGNLDPARWTQREREQSEEYSSSEDEDENVEDEDVVNFGTFGDDEVLA
jgi:hypothetical protein